MQPRASVVDRRNVLLCIALFLLAVVATNPVLEMGVNDDWSHNHIAREFARSGHVAYNGWAASMLLPQIIWSSLFIRMFGFSFLAARLSTVALGAFLIPVLYYLGVESGLEAPFAAFVTLLSVLSPVVMPETVSFMADVPAWFFFTLCVFAAVKSWKARDPKTCVAWGGLVAIAGVLGGLDRQIYWLGPLLFLPLIAWIQRRSIRAVAGLFAEWLTAIAIMAYSLVWFLGLPYILVEHILDQWKSDGVRYLATHTILVAADLGLTSGLILLPVLIGYALPGFRAGSRRLAAFAIATVLAAQYFFAVRHDHKLPSIGNIITKYGILPPDLVDIGTRPVVLGPLVCDLLMAAVLLSLTGCGLALWKRGGRVPIRVWNDPVAPALVLGLAFAAVWLPAMLYRSAEMWTFDRYLIPFLPLAAIPLLRFYQENIDRRVSRLSWALLALFAAYGVATTHDSFAGSRARLSAAEALEHSGVPRTEITAGFEYDGWTQLEAAGHINNHQIENPVGAYRPAICSGPPDVNLWYARMMPTVHPRYFVVLSREPDLVDAPARPIGYITWLPPARRQIFTQELPGGGHAGCQ